MHFELLVFTLSLATVMMSASQV